MLTRIIVLTAALASAAAGCSAADSEVATTVVATPAGTVPIGDLPERPSGDVVPTIPVITLDTVAVPDSTTGPDAPLLVVEPLVDDVDGNRVLLIGDTALAATTTRATDSMCQVVNGFGWDVEVEAEPGRTIAFADEVISRVADDWDVVGLMFGHYVETTVDDFGVALDALLERLAARPVILYTVAEIGEDQVAVNEVLRDRDAVWPNVVLIDWAEKVGIEPEVLVEDGGPTPTDEGAGRLGLFTAALLGRVDTDVPGACVESVFVDDSAIIL